MDHSGRDRRLGLYRDGKVRVPPCGRGSELQALHQLGGIENQVGG